MYSVGMILKNNNLVLTILIVKRKYITKILFKYSKPTQLNYSYIKHFKITS